MPRARKKPGTAGEKSPAVSTRRSGPTRYRFNQPHTHAGVDYVAGDRIELTEAKAARIRQFAGADAITEDEG